MKPGYKQTEVGVIPEEWDVSELRTLTRSHNSGIYKRHALYGRGCNIIGVSDIYDIDKVDGQSFAYVPLSAQERAKHTLNCSDLLYGESSLVREGIARTVYVTERGAGTAFAWHTRRYSIEQRMLISSYLYYYLQSRPARAHMVSQSIQTAITGINTIAYFACPITVPPFAEQEAIAEALGDADALIDSLEQLVAKKRRLKQGAMQELLTGEKRLPGFTGEWEVRCLGDLFEITSSRRVFQSEWKTEGVPFYRARELAILGEKGCVTNELFISKEMYGAYKRIYGVPRIGDMLVTGVGTLGKAYIVSDDHEFYFKDGNIIWFQISGKVSSEFLRQLYLTPLITKQIDDASAGTTVGTYTISGARKTAIPFPSLAEQTAIAAILSDMDAEIAAGDANVAKARQLKEGMVQELLTGRIRLV